MSDDGSSQLLRGTLHLLKGHGGSVRESCEYPQERPPWLPKLFTEREREERTATYMEVVARLRGGVTLDQAQAEMNAVAAALADEYPTTNAETGVRPGAHARGLALLARSASTEQIAPA